MQQLSSVVAALAILATSSPAPAAARTVDEVIARHLAARGGDAWSSIRSMKIEGAYTAFSQVGPFTLIRQRGDQLRMSCHWNNRPVEIGFDGETAWQITPRIELPIRMVGLDRQVLMQEVDFATPFFDYQARGARVELLENTEIDGQEALRLKLTRADGYEEIWYLDPDTYLEMARDSTGSDLGRPMPQRTFFDDFRNVGGVRVPHYVESQWYTRTRVMEVESVEFGTEFAPEVFQIPPPKGMEKILPMAGTWQVQVATRGRSNAPWQTSERQITIESRLSGALLHQVSTTGQGAEVETILTWDRFRNHYVQTSINDFTGHSDIQQGEFDDSGRLTVSNAETGTTWTGFGRTFLQRSSYFDIGEDSFKAELERSIDGGKNWFIFAKMTYSRAGD